MIKDLIDELKWRNMIHNITPNVVEQLNKEMTAGYVGFDPTADSLHIGNLVPIMLLVHLQRAGHKPIVLVGGATGLIGDPSGKSKERQLLSVNEIEHNLNSQKNQLKKFLDFDESKPNFAEIVNNSDWFNGIGFLEFVRDIGKHITINYMMQKDSVKNRQENGMSFTEFTYQLIQGFDFLHLFREKNVKIQLGGSDQWGNITTGLDLISKIHNSEGHAITAPLVKKSDGTKFGKSEGGNIWLDRNKTSPYKFFQFWLNVSDEDALNWFRLFSLKDREEILMIEEKHKESPNLRLIQNALAEELTIRIHSEEDLSRIKNANKILFGKSTINDLKSLDENIILDVFSDLPKAIVSKSMINSSIVELLHDHTGFFDSRGSVRRMINSGGISINKNRINSDTERIDLNFLLNNKYLIAQRGRKEFFLIIADE